MKYINFIIAVIFLFISQQDEITEYLNTHIKEIEIQGELIKKTNNEEEFIFEIKSNSSDIIKVIKLPKGVYNSSDIYKFIVPGDIFYKQKGELVFRLGHKSDQGISVKLFNLIKQNE